MRKPKIANPEIKFYIAKGLLIFVGLVISFRLFQIQILNHTRYKAEARKQQFQDNIIYAKRGSITTSDGYPVAQSIMAYTVYAIPKYIESPRIMARQIAEIVGIETNELESLFRSDSSRIRIASGLNIFQKEQIQRISDKGFVFEQGYQRFYPEQNMLSHTLGFIGRDRNGFETGYYGIEQFYDGDLSGSPGKMSQEKSASGNIILWGKSERIDPIDGNSIKLTIDRNVQFTVERHLKDGVEKYAAKSGSVLLVEPSTGNIIAMANYPDYSPLNYTKYVDQKEILRNSAISVVYEPGSVIKAITMASAIDAGVVQYDSTYNDTGPRVFSGHKVDNWDGKHHGVETMTSILQHSNNLGAAYVGMQLGDEQLLNYFNKFGLGRKLGIDLEGEEQGITYYKTPLKDIELANASFGQGISFTPLQVVMAFSAIANDGYLMTPKVVSEIDLSNGEVKKIEDRILSRPISSSTSDIMVKMLTDTVSGGEAKFFVTKKYQVAGKTGTAQIPTKGGYDETRTNATFVGFFPSYKNFVMLVKLEEPRSPSGYAAETAVPLWMRISEDLANYYNLPPDK